MLPAAVSGSALTSDTATGADLGETGAAGRAMIAALGTKDIAAEDLLVAQAYDTNGELDLYLLGFQAPGTPAADLAPIVLDTWLSASTSGVTTSTVTLGGKELTKVSYGDGGAVSYVRATPGEAVWSSRPRTRPWRPRPRRPSPRRRGPAGRGVRGLAGRRAARYRAVGRSPTSLTPKPRGPR